MNINKKYFVSRLLYGISLFAMSSIVIFHRGFEDKTFALILALIATSSVVIFGILSEKYDENKTKEQVKNTTIFLITTYILFAVAYILLFLTEANIILLVFIMILIIILTVIYYINDRRLKKQFPIDKQKF